MKKIFSTKGRLGRKNYVLYNTIPILAIFIKFIIFILLSRHQFQTDSVRLLGFFQMILGLSQIILGGIILGVPIILTIKRLHDIALSGWCVLLALLPLFLNDLLPPNIIIVLYINLFIIIAFIPGTDGDNKYGPKDE